MRQMRPVLWTKGVLLSPQHLQTQDRFLEDLLEFQLSTLTFCPWGFHRLEVDREQLAGGTFAISTATGIFPDGLPFDMPGSDATPAPKLLDGLWEPDQQALHLYLAIPEYRYGGHNGSGPFRDRDTRYRAEELLRRDETTGLSEKPIQVARKNFRILAEGESLEGSTVLRVARLTRAPGGGYQLDTRFVPPLIDIQASEFVMAVARRLVEILAARGTTLAAPRRQKNHSLPQFGIADVASCWRRWCRRTRCRCRSSSCSPPCTPRRSIRSVISPRRRSSSLLVLKDARRKWLSARRTYSRLRRRLSW